MKILTGTKVLLAPMQESDMPFFWETYSANNEKYLYDLAQGDKEKYKLGLLREFIEGAMFGWIIYTNMGKKSNKIGVIWGKEFNNHTVELNGALISKMLRGLVSRLRRKKGAQKGWTFAEEALYLATRYCFNDLGKTRVHAAIDEENKLAIELTKKVGYRKEGTLRNFTQIRDKCLNITMMSLLKKEFNQGE